MYFANKKLLGIVHSALLVGAVGLGLSLAGCGKVTKVADCAKLTASVESYTKTVESSINNMNQESETSSASVKAVGEAMEKLADAVKGLELKDEKLKELAQQYEAAYRTGAKAAKDFAAAIDAKDLEAAKTSSENLEKVQPTESKLVDQINAYCRGK